MIAFFPLFLKQTSDGDVEQLRLFAEKNVQI